MTRIPLRTPEQIASQSVTEIPFLRLPEPSCVFSDRARRLDQLAAGHAMGDYLSFMSAVAGAQQAALDAGVPVAPPGPALLEQSREHGMPPLNTSHVRRDPFWHDMLRRMLRTLIQNAEGPSAQVMTRLESERGDFYEAQASKLLAGIVLGLDRAAAPFIGAALQVYWTHLVAAVGKESLSSMDVPNICPCCGSRPTASIARIGSQESGYRYLYCSLCSSEWHMVRIKCTHCDTTNGIHYMGIEGASPAVKAECCDTCDTYLKIFYMDRDPLVEPVADDLASVMLDLLVAQTGKAGSGVNLMLIQGDA